MNSACRYFETPECNINSIGGNEMSNAPGYQMPNSINAHLHQAVSQEPHNYSQTNSHGLRDISYLLDDLMATLHQNQQIEKDNPDQFSAEAYNQIHTLSNHRLKPTLYNLLIEHKQISGLFPEHSLMSSKEDDQIDIELQRLDNMLIAEEVAELPPGFEGPRLNSQIENAGEHSDYRQKLLGIKQWYHEWLNGLEIKSKSIKNDVMNVLRTHSNVRPILPKEVEITERTIEKKLNGVKMQLKQHACELVINLKKRLTDARRKRKNFSKKASDILNNYFNTHLSNPYPSEETKDELARQCNITVSQVTNWFGNKRIRYKKTMNKAQVEANINAAKKTGPAVARGAGRPSPYPVASNRSHGTPTPPMLSPAPSVSSQPDFQAAYGMNFGVYPGYPYPGPGPSGYDPMNFHRSSPESQ